MTAYYVEDTRNDVTQSHIGSVLLACNLVMNNQLALQSSETTVLILDVGRTALTSDSGGALPPLKVLGVVFYSGLILAGEWNSPLSCPEPFSLLSTPRIHL